MDICGSVVVLLILLFIIGFVLRYGVPTNEILSRSKPRVVVQLGRKEMLVVEQVMSVYELDRVEQALGIIIEEYRQHHGLNIWNDA